MTDPAETVVIDASVLVELLANGAYAAAAAQRLSRTVLNAPAHVDAEVLSALGACTAQVIWRPATSTRPSPGCGRCP